MSAARDQADELLDLLASLQQPAGISLPDWYQALLDQIRGLISSLLTAKIGGSGLSVAQMIDGVKKSIEALLAGVNTNITGVYNGIKQRISDVTEKVNESVVTIVNNVSGLLSQAVITLNNKIGDIKDDIVESVGGVIDGIAAAFREAIGWLVNKIDGVISALRNIGKDIADNIRSAIASIADSIKSAFRAAVSEIAHWIMGVVDSVGDWISGIYDTIHSALTDTWNGIKAWYNDTINSIKAWLDDTWTHLKNTYENTKNSIEGIIENIKVQIANIKQWLSDWFWSLAPKVATWFADNVMPRFASAVDGAKALSGAASLAWTKIMSGDYQGAFDVIDGLFEGLGVPGPTDVIYALLSTAAYMYASVQVQFVPMQITAAKRANIALALDPIPLDLASQAYYRDLLSKDGYIYNARLSGIAPTTADISLEASRPLPSPGQVQQLYLRGEIDVSEHDRLLSHYGFTGETIEQIKALYAIIPGVQDIITMAVREVFSPDVAERFGQFEDLPEAFVTWAGKQGLTREWAERYWASHWSLPSPQMGFEMLHRGVIDKDDLNLLLRALDIMPYWRERLTEISYNPLTRVDVRRMFKLGVLTEEEVYRSYLDIGYNEENARRLTEFTKVYSPPEDQTETDTFRSLARGVYSQAYKKNIISRDEYYQYLATLGYAPPDISLLISIDDYTLVSSRQMFDINDYRRDWQRLLLQAYDKGLIILPELKTSLENLGYTPDEVTLEISIIDYNRQLTQRKLIIDKLHDQYVNYTIDITRLYDIFGMYNFEPTEIDRLLGEWEIERSFRTRKPSMSDLKAFLKSGLLTLEEYLDELRGLGYHEKYVQMYAQLL